MEKNITNVLFFLQILHFREDLELNLFKTLKRQQDNILEGNDLEKIYGQKVHEGLLKNTKNILIDCGVLTKVSVGFQVNLSSLEKFIELVEMAKAAREYEWPPSGSKPFLFVSPPSLITEDIAGDVDDIANLIINLVSSTKTSISIMSPFINKDGLTSVLAPLNACTNNIDIALYLTAKDQGRKIIFNQVVELIPPRVSKNLKVYFCSPELVEEGSLPHAKVLVIDSCKGYLGSANFTKQGLTTRFEVGVGLEKKQSQTIDKLLQLLVNKGLFSLYSS